MENAVTACSGGQGADRPAQRRRSADRGDRHLAERIDAWCWKISYDEAFGRFSPGVQLLLEVTKGCSMIAALRARIRALLPTIR